MMRMISILLMLILVIGCSASDPVTSATPNDQSETPSATEGASENNTPETPAHDNEAHGTEAPESEQTPEPEQPAEPEQTPEPEQPAEPEQTPEPEQPADPEQMPEPSSETPSDETPQAIPIEVEYSSETEVNLLPDVQDEPYVRPRPRRRMNIDQLQSAIKTVSGGIGWTERQGRNDVNLFEQLSATLGKPDYRERTDEELEPTVLFQKFLGDASRSVCSKMLTADLEHETRVANGESSDWQPRLLVNLTSEDTLQSAPTAFRDNVRFLVQRFHGRNLDVDDSALVNWHWFVRSALHVTQDPKQSWLGLCVALFNHPDFYTF